MALRLYNSLTHSREPFVPRDPARITMYTCGPTVYDDAHIGNFRSFLAADLLRRWLESPLCEIGVERSSRRVVHVMNITDVGHMTEDDAPDGLGEDKMAVAGRRLLDAKKSGTLPPNADADPNDPVSIARFYEARFREDAVRLGLKVAIEAESDPSLMPRATEHIGAMIRVIEALIARGHAYIAGKAPTRAVYFDVRTFAPYGRLSGNTLEHLREGAGGRIDAANQARKHSPADFLLWKENAAHLMQWPSPWGRGYPGWHIECSAMSIGCLADMPAGARAPDGDPIIDIHTGGEDMTFPHHECEIAQSCCAFNDDPDEGCFASMWVHTRFLLVEGEKMSKSKGNFFTPRELFEQGHDPAAVRLELIKTHYRANANFTQQGLRDSARMVSRWRRFAHDAQPGEPSEAASRMLAAFGDAMNDDLNIAGALGVVNAWMGEREPGPGDADALAMVNGVVAILGGDAPEGTTVGNIHFAPGLEALDRVVTLVNERLEARQAHDFARADQLRDELAAMGYAIKDASGGEVEVDHVR